MKNTQNSYLQNITPPFFKFYQLLIILYFLLNGLILVAQIENNSTPFIDNEEFCGTPPSELSDPTGVFSRSIDPAYLNNFEPVSFNIFFWGIAKDDGTWNGPQMTLQKAQDAVVLLNEHFGQFNICFNLKGMDIIYSDTHHSGSSVGNVINFANNVGYVKENSYNIYVPDAFDGPTGATSYYITTIGIRACCVVHPTFIHEMGHTLNLYHTFENDNKRPHPTECERVTRNINDPNYNASDINGAIARGDKIHDTNAVPNFFREQHNYVAYAVEEANIGYSWNTARTEIAFSPNGFNSFPDAIAIEQALIDYGFTTAEINHLKFNSAEDNAYYNLTSKTYEPDSRINDANSPFFKDCQGTPYQMTTTDIKNFMAYTHSTSKELFTIGQGIRMQEAINNNSLNPGTQIPYNNNLVAAMSQNSYDLYIKDHSLDIGQEPNIHTEVLWHSPDIWVRNQNDGQNNQVHQNPEYDPVIPNYIYVRIKNKGCNTSSGNDELKLYWAKANTNLLWDLHWNGTLFVNDVLMGDAITTMTVPNIEPGEEVILEAQWLIPNPEDYIGINDNPWHFCLLARIESEDEPMAVSEVAFLPDNVKNNNNIAWKNTTVIDIIPNTPTIGGLVAVSNPFTTTKTYSLELFSESNESGKAIYDEAEVTIEMDEIIFNGWEIGNKTGANFITTTDEKKLIAGGNQMIFDNIHLAPHDYGTVYLTFNFLSKELTNKTKYTYHVIQRDKATNQIVGGETYEVRKQPRSGFTADAGDSKEINQSESVTIEAANINEDAVYNWYSSEGNLIATGSTITVSPEFTKEYKLEIISNLDGIKDYDEVEVKVNPYHIQNMVPNPVSTQLTVNYMAVNASSAYIMVVNHTTGSSNNYILDTSINEITIDVTTYPTGLYSVILVANGEVQDSKSLLKN